MVEISEDYEGEVPPEWVRPTVERLLGSMPERLLAGLRTVILTDSESIGRGKTHRVAGRKFSRRDCRGFYFRGTGGKAAGIQLAVDNILANVPKRLFALQLVRDLVLARTLYHELGHHLNATVGNRARTEEGGAENWRRSLHQIHFDKHYWLSAPLFVAAARLWYRLRPLRAKRTVT